MTAHHEGASDMLTSVRDSSKPGVRALAEAVRSSQLPVSGVKGSPLSCVDGVSARTDQVCLNTCANDDVALHTVTPSTPKSYAFGAERLVTGSFAAESFLVA
jgi:hypothetical protein